MLGMDAAFGRLWDPKNDPRLALVAAFANRCDAA